MHEPVGGAPIPPQMSDDERRRRLANVNPQTIAEYNRKAEQRRIKMAIIEADVRRPREPDPAEENG
jgi:hypothetical protein